MKIVADENIPLVEYYFSAHGEVILKSGREICRDDVIDADILLVRSITQVNENLLENTQVKFVGSTTIGMDHLDINWLNQAEIPWAIAKGCNATAVVEYVLSVLAALQREGFLLKPNLRAGVIGVGEIGMRVVEKLRLLDFEVLLHDPIRAENESSFSSVALEDFVDLDFITLHTPLTFHGKYPTHHLIAENFLRQQKKGCILLNTGRGSVIDFFSLKKYGTHLLWCLDVWENEPLIDLDVLQSTWLATPHIAGYSVQSKYRGIEMIYRAALCEKVISDLHIPSAVFPTKIINFDHVPENWQDLMLKIYDPLQTSLEMKKSLLKKTNTFDDLRKNFVDRHEIAYLSGLWLSDEDACILREQHSNYLKC